jgi:hypothetical protein
LQFETLVEATEADEEAAAETTGNEDRKAPSGAKSSVPSVASAEASAEKVSDGLDNKGGAEVVRLDRFRKK